MFPYPCPSCSQRLLAPAERAGQRTICPKCLRPLTIPKPDSTAVEDPKTLIDPSEMPFPVLADQHTPYPDSMPIPQFAAVELSTVAAVHSAPIELRSVAFSEDLTFELPDAPALDRAGVTETSFPKQSVTVTPPPCPAKLPTRSRRSSNSDTRGMVVLNPTGMFAVDMTADLTAAISMRMNPPPEHSIDRRLIIGAWAFGTLSALGLWLCGLFYNPECLPFVALLGGAMLVFGLIWRAYLVGQEESVLKGVICLLPPFNILRLFQKSGENGHRPLRFAASGAAVLALFATTATARALVDEKFGAATVVEDHSTAAKLRRVADQPARLLTTIQKVGTPEAVRSGTAEDKSAVVLELQKLLKHNQPTVRMSALLALDVWSESDARSWVLAALRGKDDLEFHTALSAADKIHNADIIAAVAEKLKTREHRLEAQRSLVAIGKPAEDTLIMMLSFPNDVVVLSIIDVLTQIGEGKSLVALRNLGDIAVSEILKSEAKSAAEQLSNKLSK